ADDEDDETESDKDDIYNYKICVHKDEDEEMINFEVDDSDKDDEETSSMYSVPVFMISEPTVLTPIQESPSKATITTLPPPSLRVAKLEKDAYELKKIDLFAEALTALKTQVPSVIDNYLGSKVGDVENAMDKGVADTVKDHKRMHDDSENDDDEDPPAGLNQGKAPSKVSKIGKSASAKEPVEEPIAEVVMDDAGDDVVHDDDQPQDTSEPKTSKTPNLDCFKQPL
ncbi:hypothetical protein Tco_1180395, partial [Tanacetum coccineum]